MVAAEELAGRIGQTAEACEALGIARSTLYRRRQTVTSNAKRRPRSHRALDVTEREQVLGALHSERFVDKAPAQVWATLLDEGIYYCSIRTMYRILEENGEVRERRNQLRHPNYQKPELLAEAPNQVWSWDITKLRGPVKWTYYYLYVILDIFSRYVSGWMLARRESAELARRERRHSGIGLMTPAAVHYGLAEQLTTARRQILLEAHRARPERFVRGMPQPPVLPPQAWINPPPEKTMRQEAAGVTFSGWSIPGVPPDSGQRDQISPHADRDRPEPTSLSALIEAH